MKTPTLTSQINFTVERLQNVWCTKMYILDPVNLRRVLSMVEALDGVNEKFLTKDFHKKKKRGLDSHKNYVTTSRSTWPKHLVGVHSHVKVLIVLLYLYKNLYETKRRELVSTGQNFITHFDMHQMSFTILYLKVYVRLR